MTTHELDAFARADRTAEHWLDTVADHLGTDRPHAYRLLRAWLHTVRDRLGVDAAAHFSAQLPLLLRGLFFDGWSPAHVPVKYDARQFLGAVAREARVPVSEARRGAAAVTTALMVLCSPGQIDHLLSQLPGQLRDVLLPDGPVPEDVDDDLIDVGPPDVAAVAPAPAPEDRLDRVEREIGTVVEALRALVHGLEGRPAEEPQPDRGAAAARRAHQILLTLGAPG